MDQTWFRTSKVAIDKLEGQADEAILMGRPMSQRLMESLTSIVDKEKRKQAIIFEFTPNISKSHDHLVSVLDHINIQIIQLEKLLGKENRLTQFSYETQGFNLKTGLIQMHAWLTQHSPENKQSDRHFDDINNRIKLINDGIRKKLDNSNINLQVLKEIKDLYDLYKGLLKYETIVDRSLTLARTWDRLTLMQEERPFDYEAMDIKSEKLKKKSQDLQVKVAEVADKMIKSFGELNTKLQDLENKMKTKL